MRQTLEKRPFQAAQRQQPGRQKKYTVEKTLYFADRDIGMHVSSDEPRTSDLMENVTSLLGRGLLEQVAVDDGGEYFKTTKAGKVRLLELQIEWRKQNGKSIDSHEAKLAELKAA